MRKFILPSYLIVTVFLLGCQDYSSDFEDLKNRFNALQTEVTTLKGIQSEIASLKNQLQGISTIQTEIVALKSQIEGLASIRTNINELETKITAIESKLSEISEKLDRSNANISSNSSANKELKATLVQIQQKLNELASRVDETLTVKDLRALEDQIQDVKSDLIDRLSETSSIYDGDLEAVNFSTAEFILTNHSNITQINGDLNINTNGLSATQLINLGNWVSDIELITGDLTVTHLAPEREPFKFSALRSVRNLKAIQTEAHYPRLSSSGTISFHSRTERVDLSNLTSGNFDSNEINLTRASLLDISSLENYSQNELSITLDGRNSVLRLNALKNIGSDNNTGSLTIEGVGEVELNISSLGSLIVTDVEILVARNLKGTDVTINEDVERITLGTDATGDGIKELDLRGADDLEILVVKGTYDTDWVPGTDIIIPPSVEQATLENIHCVVSRYDPSHAEADEYQYDVLKDNFDSLTLKGKIHDVEIGGTALEGELVLGHNSPDGGYLRIINNDDITKLSAPLLDGLKVLEIQGNEELEQVDFPELVASASEAEVKIGGAGTDEANKLIASNITIALSENEQGQGSERRGRISEDSSNPAGIVALKDFLIDAETVSVYYDQATEYQPGRSDTTLETDVTITQGSAEEKLVVKETTNSDNTDRTSWLR